MCPLPSRFARKLGIASLLCLLPLAGCGRTGGRDLSLDAEQARQSFNTFLETWKQGKTAGDLKALEPSIIAGDEDWSAGAKLVSYKVAPQEFNDGTNLHLTAELQLNGKNSKKSGKAAVSYVVGTSPVITIFRK
jgi:hypothetical protein